MSEQIEVKPSPVQRNTLDVALELTQLHTQHIGLANSEEIGLLFAKYFAIANCCQRNFTKLQGLVPEEILDKIQQ